jgi:hypothetical protein
MAVTSLSRSKAAAVRRPRLAVAHDDDAVGILEDFAEEVGDQDATRAAGDDAAHEAQQLAGGVGVERRGRLVEDDETQRVVGDREGARHFDHLALADREVAYDVARADAVAGKDLVEPGEDEIAGAAAPTEP